MPHKVTPREQTCLVCSKKFKGPNYTGCGADVNRGLHVVDAVKFYSQSGGLQLQWKTEQTFPDPEGKGAIVRIPGKTAQFIQGMFVTTDPEEIDFMREYPGLCTYEQWYEAFVPEKMRVEKALRENKDSKVIIDSKNAEIRKLREQLGLDPDTGEKKA